MPQRETRDRTQVRLKRELNRLEALDARRRRRGWVRRGVRGGLGSAAGFWTLVKLKLGGKLAVAAVVGLGLAWPAALIVLLGLVVLSLEVASLLGGEPAPRFGLDGCNDGFCACRGERVRRLEDMIARRRAWLAAPSGPVPSVRRDPLARRR